MMHKTVHGKTLMNKSNWDTTSVTQAHPNTRLEILSNKHNFQQKQVLDADKGCFESRLVNYQMFQMKMPIMPT